ncbi:unnamed protein product [Ectocarpus sp. 12 AP-2014]
MVVASPTILMVQYRAGPRIRSVPLGSSLNFLFRAEGPAEVGQFLLVDVTIVNPCANRSIDKSIPTPGSTLEDRAVSKANHYAGTFDPSKSTLVTAAFSTHGGLGQGTNRLIVLAIADHLAYEAFCGENFDDETASVRLKGLQRRRIGEDLPNRNGNNVCVRPIFSGAGSVTAKISPYSSFGDKSKPFSPDCCASRILAVL